MKRIFILAGEASGDALGADLVSGLKELAPEWGVDIEIDGVGGPLMKRVGVPSLFPIDELSIMGIAEVLPALPRLFRRRDDILAVLAQKKYDALVTIDAPDFGLRVAKKACKTHPDLKTIHYVAPSVWAWRAGRAKKMARVIGDVLCLLPFEPELMRKAGLNAHFVGHPIMRKAWPSTEAARSALGAGPHILLLPGSRKSEIKRMMPIYKEVIAAILDDPSINVHIPVPAYLVDDVRGMLQSNAHIHVYGSDDSGFQFRKDNLFVGADVALATSGTVSLELAAAGCPSVVAYDAAPLTTYLIKKLVKARYASLPNILLNQEIIPEYLFEKATGPNLIAAVSSLLANQDMRTAQKNGFDKLRSEFQAPENAAARSVLDVLTR